MWTQAHRETYKQSGAGLPSDLTEAQWERLEPLIPAAKWGGRPKTGSSYSSFTDASKQRTDPPSFGLPHLCFPHRIMWSRLGHVCNPVGSSLLIAIHHLNLLVIPMVITLGASP